MKAGVFFTAILLAILGLSVFSHWSTTRATNELDVDRTSQALKMAVQSQISQVKAVAEDNAKWDDAVVALYRDHPDQSFGLRAWGAVSDNEEIYDTVFAINGMGQVLMAYQHGAPVSVDFARVYGGPLAALLQNVREGSTSSAGLVRAQGGLNVVGVARVEPTTPTLRKLRLNRADVFLVFGRKVSPKMLAGIGGGLVLDRLSLEDKPKSPYVALRDPTGRVVGHLGWLPGNPGYQAFWKASLAIGLAVFLCAVGCAMLLTFFYRLYARLQHSAHTDALSGLPNRRALEDEIALNLAAGRTLGLAFLDLDGFKAINDNYGHAVGDQLIQDCSVLARRLARPTQMVSRLGGDEFAVLAVGEDAQDQLAKFSARLLKLLSQPYHLNGRTFMVGVSIGVALSGEGVAHVTELMRRADIALYASKRAGKLRMTEFDPTLDRQQADAHGIDQRMRIGLDQGHFQVHYQPLVDARTNAVVALEALLRWNDPAGIASTPDQFVPVAEESGLIDRLGLFVLDRACRDAMEWEGVQLSINVSAAQLRNPEFPRRLKRILSDTGFPGDRLELEITETYVVLDPVVAVRVLAEIQLLGVRIALDDFGSGYASIGFLRQFSFDTLKIDRSLVVDAVSDDAARAMVQASIVVARSLGMLVVAEGIESQAHADYMRTAGCDQLQGWLYSRAVCAADVDLMISTIGRKRPRKAIAA